MATLPTNSTAAAKASTTEAADISTPAKTAAQNAAKNTVLSSDILAGVAKLQLASFTLPVLNQLYQAFKTEPAGTTFADYVVARLSGLSTEDTNAVSAVTDTQLAFRLIQRRILKQ